MVPSEAQESCLTRRADAPRNRTQFLPKAGHSLDRHRQWSHQFNAVRTSNLGMGCRSRKFESSRADHNQSLLHDRRATLPKARPVLTARLPCSAVPVYRLNSAGRVHQPHLVERHVSFRAGCNRPASNIIMVAMLSSSGMLGSGTAKPSTRTPNCSRSAVEVVHESGEN